ncbi:MAG: DUF116 domain-containing protein [Selenomonadaceae bacterium]|nr:DUF116 domain-containing protein [Selenomonadaceae bacterium]
MGKKYLLIMLNLISALFLSLILYGIWKISFLGLEEIHKNLPMILGGIFLIISVFSVFLLLLLTLAIKGIIPLFFERQIYRLINVLFPVSLQIGKIFKIKRRTLEGSFIEISNILFSKHNFKVKGKDLLVITPHCLQLATCPHKITRDPKNCKRCGGCNIGDLMKLADEYGFTFFVATGGTLARHIIKEKRPKLVLAIACERDLMSGIQDVYPLPAVGVLNIRPNGPCYNTKVDLDEVKKVLQSVIID